MKDYALIETEKNTKVVSTITLQTIKTIPLSYKGCKTFFVQNWFNKLTFDKKFTETLKKIRKKEPYAFELINNKQVKGARIIELKVGFRFELVYENGNRINIDEMLYRLCENKLETAYLNY